MKKTEILINKLSILELGKTLMHELWYNYVQPKYGEKAELCYMDTDGFIAYTKTNDIYMTMWKILKLNLILIIMNWIDHY